MQSIARQIRKSHQRLEQLNRLFAARKKQLAEQTQESTDSKDHTAVQRENANYAIDAYVSSLRERLRVADENQAELESLIADKRAAVEHMKEAEERDASFRRRIAGLQGMLIQLEKKLSALNLVDTDGGITVKPLLAKNKAHVVGPSLRKSLSFYAMMAFGACCTSAVLLETTAKTFRNGEQIQRALKLPVLAHIPFVAAKRITSPNHEDLDASLSVVHRPYSPAAEAIRGIRTAMAFEHGRNASQVFLITSPMPGDGKSTVSANVGCSLAQTGKRTLLIDLDLRSPKLSRRFRLDNEIGITKVLNGELTADEAVHTTAIDHLDILPCGPLPSNPAEALTLSEMGTIFQWARTNYDYVIVDTPPVLMVSDPTIVASHVDAALLVMRIRKRCRPNAKETIELLRRSNTIVMGVVVNNVKFGNGFNAYQCRASGAYQYSGYGYGYGDAERYRRQYQKQVDQNDAFVVKGAAFQSRGQAKLTAR